MKTSTVAFFMFTVLVAFQSSTQYPIYVNLPQLSQILDEIDENRFDDAEPHFLFNYGKQKAKQPFLRFG
ncbi:hypothetical protein QR680_015705 [Steinernema hermaphroditum]|uniref:Uncharacterized protein n=1 Tax=Steinernema hermaphroditum TaxID=289476 RepID=A0AA39HBA2_9BILA|nr:hypothetical protein QR680_015705 [Steinernema hermaphroditum]